MNSTPNRRQLLLPLADDTPKRARKLAADLKRRGAKLTVASALRPLGHASFSFDPPTAAEWDLYLAEVAR